MLENAPLGKKSLYIDTYEPQLLFTIPRVSKRTPLKIASALPFKGVDIWNAYELSWLNLKGKPAIAQGIFAIPCESPNLIESKSLKLYLNSFNQSHFKDMQEVKRLITQDLTAAVGAPVMVHLAPRGESNAASQQVQGACLDDLDIGCEIYEPSSNLLTAKGPLVTEIVYSHLLKSNCLVTGQPDWGSIYISYEGTKIDHEGMLKYIISFRKHCEFAEPFVERVFVDIMHTCMPKRLTVYARYTRRGGLDINPFRSNFEETARHQWLYQLGSKFEDYFTTIGM